MILEKETLEKFGYGVNSLTKGSKKMIVVKCDYCEQVFEVQYKNRIKSMEYIQKDACIKCKYIKREEVSLQIDGVKNSSQRADVRAILKEKTTFGTEEFKQKRSITMIEKYGTDNTLLLPAFKNVINEKYGVSNVSQSKEIRDKVKQTNLERYGAEEFLSSKYAREKINKTIKNKYGVDNLFQSEEIKKRIKQTCLDKYGVTHFLKNTENAQEASRKSLKTRIQLGKVRLYEGKTISDWRKESDYSDSRFRTLINEYGFERAIKMNPQISSLEYKICNFLSEYDIKYVLHYKISKYIADIYIPEYNLILELDGLYWHSEKVCEDKNYHRKKKEVYNEAGFKSLFFREDEINEKFPIIQSMILHHCKQSQRIFARKCVMKEVDKKIASEFINQNHLMGRGRGISLGLYYREELISVLTMNGNEISRFCTKQGYTIVGGFSKLISNITSPIITFIDLRYGSGDYLLDLGFTLKNIDISFKWTNCNETFHRLKYKGNSGYDNGMVKIWDCGQAKYIK